MHAFGVHLMQACVKVRTIFCVCLLREDFVTLYTLEFVIDILKHNCHLKTTRIHDKIVGKAGPE
jgi:hypothetical protein